MIRNALTSIKINRNSNGIHRVQHVTYVQNIVDTVTKIFRNIFFGAPGLPDLPLRIKLWV